MGIYFNSNMYKSDRSFLMFLHGEITYTDIETSIILIMISITNYTVAKNSIIRGGNL